MLLLTCAIVTGCLKKKLIIEIDGGVHNDPGIREYDISRENQDAFAVNSVNKALNAIDKGYFKDQITPTGAVFPGELYLHKNLVFCEHIQKRSGKKHPICFLIHSKA